jgi:tRNA pseudouridine38-40 synthase
MPTFKITLAYDGTGFVGWQRQPAGVSIQGLLEDALAQLDNHHVAVTGAGRTDAGVHAVGQVAAFSLQRPMTSDAVMRAINARLPADVRVLSAEEASAAFNPRFDARSKSYRYRIWNADVLNPFERQYAWHVPGTLDVESMASAASRLLGRHDFSAFQVAGTEVQTTERAVSSSVLSRSSAAEPLVTYDVTGDGFLRHMVRSIVGTLVEIGRGRHPSAWIDDVVTSRDRAAAGPTAPPQGLFLLRVEYAR